MPQQKLNITNQKGEALAAILTTPPNKKPISVAIFAHCFTCGKNIKAAKNISDTLVKQGLAVLRFDFNGIGESEGAFEENTFRDNLSDIAAVDEYLTKQKLQPELLIGHSLGGAAVLLAAKQLTHIKAVVSIAAPAHPNHLTHLFEANLEQIKKDGQAEVKLAGRSFIISKEFVESLEQNEVSKTISALKKPLLLFHSPQDNTVGIENARQIYEQAHHPKSFISLDGADHLLSTEDDATYVGEVIKGWVKRYIETSTQTKDESVEDGVLAKLTYPEFTTQLITDSHEFLADEPKSAGGNNVGPDPYELLCAALAACTAMTMNMYAKRKEWDIEDVAVFVSHKRTHCEDCEHNENSQAKIDEFTRKIRLSYNLNDEQHSKLLAIADKCPVHKTLASISKIKTTEL